MNQKNKIAFVGPGKWGGGVLLPEFNKQCRVAYICHNGSAASRAVAAKYPRAKGTTNLYGALNDRTVEAVVIATPTAAHRKIAMAAFQAGKHVFLEKPGGSRKELEEIVAEAKKRNLTLAIGYEFAHHPALVEIKRMLRGDKIESLHFSWLKYGTFSDEIVPHLVCHAISIAKSLGFTKFEVVDARGYGFVAHTDIVWCDLILEDATDFTIYIDRTAPNTKSRILKLKTSSGKTYIWRDDSLFQAQTGDEKILELDVPKITPVAAEIEDFLLSIEKGSEPFVNGRFGLDVWEVVEKIQKSRPRQ